MNKHEQQPVITTTALRLFDQINLQYPDMAEDFQGSPAHYVNIDTRRIIKSFLVSKDQGIRELHNVSLGIHNDLGHDERSEMDQEFIRGKLELLTNAITTVATEYPYEVKIATEHMINEAFRLLKEVDNTEDYKKVLHTLRFSAESIKSDILRGILRLNFEKSKQYFRAKKILKEIEIYLNLAK